MRRTARFAIVLAGCGRLSFDGVEDARRVIDTTILDATVDASTCIDGDDICLPACVASDTDCITTCGDGRCVGNAGELCGNCTTDCATTASVCGNAQYDPNEDSATCYADVGPAPWMWTAQESALLAAVNAARTNGTTCPGDGAPRFAAALVEDLAMQPGTREYAWEIAHHGVHLANGCNGRTFAQRQVPWSANGGLSQSGILTTASQVVSGWQGSASLCPVLMNTGRSFIATSVAFDAQNAWVFWFR